MPLTGDRCGRECRAGGVERGLAPPRGRRRAPVALALLALLAACGPPVRVRQATTAQSYRETMANALAGKRASEWSRTAANEWGLLELYDARPERALAELRAIVVAGRGRPQDLFALAELSFAFAERGGGPPEYLAAAVYAYAYLFPPETKAVNGLANPTDPRTRLAVDIYNRAVALGFAAPGGGAMQIARGTRALPFGALEVEADPAQLQWGDRELVDLVPATSLVVTGMRNHHRNPGIGAAASADTRVRPGIERRDSMLAPRTRVAVTVLLRLRDVATGIRTGRLEGTLDVYPAGASDTVEIEGRILPLEADETAALGAALAESPVWRDEIWRFLGRGGDGIRLPMLVSLEPHRPGRIPVVFVHGTDSSPLRWADMVNDLAADPSIRTRYEFWFFFYDSGNPIPYSGLLLREALAERVKRLDPDGRDSCLHRMVVVGHSQGGLLAKLTAVRTGDMLWNGTFSRPIGEVPGTPEFRDLLHRSFFLEPLPFVARIVFVSTPHRGSFLARDWVTALLKRLVRMPADLVSISAKTLVDGPSILRSRRPLRGLPTAVDNMSPGSDYLRGLLQSPIPAGIPYHSIISVDERFPVVEEGNDGVVEYHSAHLDGAASELVVRSAHSCQSNPHTVQEVRRILQGHVAASGEGEASCGPLPTTVAR